jgi:ankyrin repeat protein
LACKEGHFAAVELLLKAGASVDVVSKIGETAVYLAVKGNHLDVLKLVLDHGAKNVIPAKVFFCQHFESDLISSILLYFKTSYRHGKHCVMNI